MNTTMQLIKKMSAWRTLSFPTAYLLRHIHAKPLTYSIACVHRSVLSNSHKMQTIELFSPSSLPSSLTHSHSHFAYSVVVFTKSTSLLHFLYSSKTKQTKTTLHPFCSLATQPSKACSWLQQQATTSDIDQDQDRVPIWMDAIYGRPTPKDCQ